MSSSILVRVGALLTTTTCLGLASCSPAADHADVPAEDGDAGSSVATDDDASTGGGGTEDASTDAPAPADAGADATKGDGGGGGGACGAWTITRDAKAPASATVAVANGQLVFDAPMGKGDSYVIIRASQAKVTGDFDAKVSLTALDTDTSNGGYFVIRAADKSAIAGIAVYPGSSTKRYVQVEGCTSAGGYVSNVGPLLLRVTRTGVAMHVEASANGETFARDCNAASAPVGTPEISFGGFGSNGGALKVAFDDYAVTGAGGCSDDFSTQNF